MERDILRFVEVVQLVDQRLGEVPIVQAVVRFVSLSKRVGHAKGQDSGFARTENALFQRHLQRIVPILAYRVGVDEDPWEDRIRTAQVIRVDPRAGSKTRSGWQYTPQRIGKRRVQIRRILVREIKVGKRDVSPLLAYRLMHGAVGRIGRFYHHSKGQFPLESK